MTAADLALALTALAGLGLRLAGVWLAAGLSTDHPAIAWATAVGQATLAAFVTLAIMAPPGVLAAVPLPARLAGLAIGSLSLLVLRRRLLPALLLGLLAMLLTRGILAPG